MAGGDVHNVNYGTGIRPEIATHIDSVRLAALELVTMSSIPGTVAALARLNVFEALARAGDGAELTAEEIAEAVSPGKAISVAYLGRLLRMVSGKSILREVVATRDDGSSLRRYGLAPLGKFLVDDAEQGSFVNLLLAYQDPGFLRTWEHLHESVVDDGMQPFARAHGGLSAWEYGKKMPEFDAVFNKAMAGHSKVYMRAILDAYHGFDEVKVLVDVGGGFGSALSLITGRYSHIRGINFDQPHVIDACPDLPGVEHVSGDMFKSIPDGGDAIFMKYILHDWNDASCLQLLNNCHRALPAEGKVIAVDCVLPERIELAGGEAMALSLDVQMLAFNDSGARERTERDLRQLGLDAGFTQMTVVCQVDHLAVMEFRKS